MRRRLIAFSSDPAARRTISQPTAERLWNSAPQSTCSSTCWSFKRGHVRSWRSPAGILPVQRQERNSAGRVLNQYVLRLKIAVDHSPRKAFATLFDEMPVLFQDFKTN